MTQPSTSLFDSKHFIGYSTTQYTAGFTQNKYHWLSLAPQDSEEWHALRRGRISASTLASALGLVSYRGTTPDTVADKMAGLIVEDLSQNMAVQHGKRTEPQVRRWYSSKIGMPIREVGIAIPYWDPYLGASIDGDLPGGCIEIKCPQKMYDALEEYMEILSYGIILNDRTESLQVMVDPVSRVVYSGQEDIPRVDSLQEIGSVNRPRVDSLQEIGSVNRPRVYDYSHIKIDHYLQMQMGMIVCEKEWEDYIVACTPQDKVYTQRVLVNHKAWWTDIYPRIQTFKIEKLFPRLNATGLKIISPAG